MSAYANFLNTLCDSLPVPVKRGFHSKISKISLPSPSPPSDSSSRYKSRNNDYTSSVDTDLHIHVLSIDLDPVIYVSARNSGLEKAFQFELLVISNAKKYQTRCYLTHLQQLREDLIFEVKNESFSSSPRMVSKLPCCDGTSKTANSFYIPELPCCESLQYEGGKVGRDFLLSFFQTIHTMLREFNSWFQFTLSKMRNPRQSPSIQNFLCSNSRGIMNKIALAKKAASKFDCLKTLNNGSKRMMVRHDGHHLFPIHENKIIPEMVKKEKSNEDRIYYHVHHQRMFPGDDEEYVSEYVSESDAYST